MNNLADLFEKFQNHGLGDLVDIIGKLAKQGMQAQGQPTTTPGWVSDPLLKPSQAAKELGCSWKTLRDSWGPKYDIQHSALEGAGRRYLASEIERVKKVILEHETRGSK